MKIKNEKKIVSMIVATMMFLSVIVAPANAEELLPEAIGGENYCISEAKSELEATSPDTAGDEQDITDGNATVDLAESTTAEVDKNEEENSQSESNVNPDEMSELEKDLRSAQEEATESKTENESLADQTQANEEVKGDSSFQEQEVAETTEIPVVADYPAGAEEAAAEQNSNEEITEKSENENEVSELNPEDKSSVEEITQDDKVQDESDEEQSAAIETEGKSELQSVENNAETSGNNNGILADFGPVTGLQAVAVPHDHDFSELEDDPVFNKNGKIRKTIGDVIIKVGESLLPFGNTISNFIKSRSNQANNLDKVETAIDMVADTASFACPTFAPLVSVGKDIVMKIWNCFK